jgi:hypothetical protein
MSVMTTINWTDAETKVFEAAGAQGAIYDYVQRIKDGHVEPTAVDAAFVAAWDNDNAGEMAIHDAQVEVVSVVRKRLERFLANSEEIKAICSALPFGFLIGLPLNAGRDGLFWDSITLRRQHEDLLVERTLTDEDFEDNKIGGSFAAWEVLEMVKSALIVEADRQAERKVVPLRKAA